MRVSERASERERKCGKSCGIGFCLNEFLISLLCLTPFVAGVSDRLNTRSVQYFGAWSVGLCIGDLKFRRLPIGGPLTSLTPSNNK
jgi:hypothetical protein